MKTIQSQIEKLENELAKLKEIANKPKSYKRWRAEYGEDYYYVDINGVFSNTEDNDGTDDNRYTIGNYYKTKEEAQKVFNKQIAITKVNDRIRELNEGWETDWKNIETYKYHIYYSYSIYDYKIAPSYTGEYDLSLLYIKSKEIGKQIINEMKTELNIIFDK